MLSSILLDTNNKNFRGIQFQAIYNDQTYDHKFLNSSAVSYSSVQKNSSSEDKQFRSRLINLHQRLFLRGVNSTQKTFRTTLTLPRVNFSPRFSLYFENKGEGGKGATTLFTGVMGRLLRGSKKGRNSATVKKIFVTSDGWDGP
ncbi:hypothetical protein CEXT_353351 [Caerostris extrusa]|uniref:Uncharacterized protein n=1 Tax=Caerostris extrusa TaxID=172846 RepID=A0AAV4WI72_CAEEX|nr:hypothetical protein CEXT_353351 [Caerostris extrusa]